MKLGIYQHYKGGYYQVLGIATHTETSEHFVAYQAMQGSFGLWVRPLSMFTEQVSTEQGLTNRFTFIGENLLNPPPCTHQVKSLEKGHI